MADPVINIEHRYEIHQASLESASQVHVLDIDGVLWLTNVYTAVDYRRRGFTRLLIRRALADCGDCDIYLRVQPYADAPVSIAALMKYYAKFGFEPTDVPGVLVRRSTYEAEQ